MRNVVKELRLTRGLSQASLGDAVGVSRQTVNSIETGRYLPSLPLAITLARFFDKTVEEVFDVNDVKESAGEEPVGKCPGVAVLAGLAYFVAGVMGDDLGFGIFGLALMLGARDRLRCRLQMERDRGRAARPHGRAHQSDRSVGDPGRRQ